ncbi:serine/threonine-protein kinase [Pseudofulvimonas gallinarii]|uniref:Non-specific serine/threonine protein kinase/serine/threonine-protein kinase n=2 Tax=Pseudofulvimonas gallinarii TaxID=634155 RepID=A0A4R3L4Y6_9GAMM|nr:non-specific serine/threonine protein kinase/serine/threonine-protein kinase [Pseudofulvimonas gallinarii]
MGAEMTDRETWQRVEALFDAAWERPAAERRAWLQRQSSGPSIIAQVLSLLDAAEEADDFLETPAAGQDESEPLLVPGERAGCWRIERAIGRGGMGEVYDAQRDDGLFEQRGALKVITGADASDWQRFDAERQILASLEHPGIARLIDGGLLATERPFMVMEYVDGLPIDEYCRQRRLPLRSCIQLVRQVAAALAHAHGRLVVHSDLKPSNILVDATGRPRLIDFGIAHLVEGGGVHRQTRLSPDYAAPEQLRDGAISTATDVYGLAAVLFKLVTGEPVRRTAGLPTPVVMARIADAAPAAVSQSGKLAEGIARAEHGLLADIDAILRKALALDPAARYASIEAFEKDLALALDHRPVRARLHERGYLVRRWLRRNLLPILATTVVVASLATGLAMAVVQEREASRQRDEAVRERARLEAIQQAVFHMFRVAGESRGAGTTASEVLDAAAQRIQDGYARDPATAAPTLHALGELYFLLNDYEAAAPLLRRLAQAEPGSVDASLIAAARYDLAQVELRLGDTAAARELIALAQAFWQSDPGRWRSRLVDSRLVEAQLLREAGDTEGAVRLLQEGLQERIELSGIRHRETGVFYNNIGVQKFALGQYEPAREAFRTARDIWQAIELEQSPDALNTLNNWGALEVTAGDFLAAEPLLREAVDLRRRNYGASAATAALLNNYGKLLLRLERAPDAIPVLEEASEQGQRFAGSGSMLHIAALSGLAEAQLGAGRIAEARDSALKAGQAARDHLGATHPATALANLALAQIYAHEGEAARATALLGDVDAIAAQSGPTGARLAAQAADVRKRYRLEAPRPTPGTARLSP